MTLKRLSFDERRIQVLDSAHKLFHKFGFSKTTIADIAADLEKSTGYVYKFFPSKESIIEANAALRLDGLVKKLSKVVQRKESAGERISKFAKTIYKFNWDLFRNEKNISDLITLSFEQKWKCAEEFRKFRDDSIKELLKQGMDSKEFQPADPDSLARVVLDSLSWMMHPLLFLEVKPSEVTPRLEAQMTFILQALK